MTASYLVESKALLAKLMAQENLSVIYEKTPMPWFDLEKRVVHLPIWKDLSEDLLTMLVWHEIGHALETPPEGWHSNILTCTHPGCTHKGWYVAKSGPDAGRKIYGDNPTCYNLVFKDYLNVCEDYRMEKRQKRRFPGVKRVLAGAYRDLMARDYFGIAKRDVNKMAFIDRINVFTKMGAFVPVNFSKPEQKLVNELLTVETWEEMVVVCKKIYEFAKKNQKQQPQKAQTVAQPSQSQDDDEQEEQQSSSGEQSDETDDQTTFTPDREEEESEGEDEGQEQESSSTDGSDDNDGDDDSAEGEESDESTASDDSDETDESDEGSNADDVEKTDETDDASAEGDEGSEKSDEQDDTEEASGEGDTAEQGEDEEESEEADAEDSLTGSEQGEDEEAPVSETDRKARENEKGLMEECNTSDSSDTNVVPLNFVMQDFDVRKTSKYRAVAKTVSIFESALKTVDTIDYDVDSKELLAAMVKRNRPQINALIAEFNRKKNASQYLRQREARSGEIDMRKIAQYKVRSDLFRSFTMTTAGKSHGLVMFLDMSGSMDGLLMYSAIEQIIVLSYFCEALSLPYEVYGFSDCPHNGFERDVRDNEALGAQNDRAFNLIAGGRTNWHIIQLLSSASGPDLLRRARQMLVTYAETHASFRHNDQANASMLQHDGGAFNRKLQSAVNVRWYEVNRKTGLDTYGTPLIPCMLASRRLIEAFKMTTKVDIVNVIHLTDGQGNGDFIPSAVEADQSKAWSARARWEGQRFDISVTDDRSKLMEYVRGSKELQFSTVEAIIKLIRNTTGARHIGFYIGQASLMLDYMKKSAGHQARETKNFANPTDVVDGLYKKLQEVGCVNVPGIAGFDSYYFIDLDLKAMNASLDNVERLRDGKMNKRQLAKIEAAFKLTSKKVQAKKFLVQQFASELATQEGQEISANTTFQRA